MQKQLYVIEYESAHWCGGQSHCVAWANSDHEAEDEAASFMESHMRELFSDGHEDEDFDGDGDPAYSVIRVELLAGSEDEEFYNMPDQRSNFYPCVNSEN